MAIPHFSTYEIRILRCILEFMDEYHTTPSMAQVAEIVYDDPDRKNAVFYHVKALREAGVMSTDPAVQGRLALKNPEKIREQIAKDEEIYADQVRAQRERSSRKVAEGAAED
jgi:hypothetical protein